MMSALVSLAAVVTMSGSVYGRGPAAPHTVTIQPGDTIWGIAATRYPGDDVRARVADIETANHLPGASVVAGQDLVLPTP